ncbi:unnamed protein product [Cylicocyclus nassatus]|uniref:Uncharacterized protein n=1 Tax=Cylicocyclus nassatus TaxID=53992 RepID=A0AA36GVC9_CYLNA|nr:unnamed protein product [Cylicocyclus nassatus]
MNKCQPCHQNGGAKCSICSADYNSYVRRVGHGIPRSGLERCSYQRRQVPLAFPRTTTLPRPSFHSTVINSSALTSSSLPSITIAAAKPERSFHRHTLA